MQHHLGFVVLAQLALAVGANDMVAAVMKSASHASPVVKDFAGNDQPSAL